MVQTTTTRRTNGKAAGKDLKFTPGHPIDDEVIVDVTDNPLHIFGRLPEGHTVSVYRVYEGDNDCVDVPDIPVMCKDGCSPLMLFNVPNPECGNGRFIQDDIWLFYQGRYKLVYNSPDGDQVIPDDVYVWVKSDTLVTRTGINLPLCGENACPPECTPEHVLQLECDCGPTHEPDCLKCETPVAFHHDVEKPCELALYLWSKPVGSKCSDEGEWHRINFAEWLDSLGGLITEVSLVGDDVISGTMEIKPADDPDDCVGRKLAINLSIGCPPSAAPIELVNGETTDEYFWTCDVNGNIIKRPITINIQVCCPENMQLGSGYGVGSCFDVNHKSYTTAYQAPHDPDSSGYLRFATTITNPFDTPVQVIGTFNHRMYRYVPFGGSGGINNRCEVIFVSGRKADVDIGINGKFPLFVRNDGSSRVRSATDIVIHELSRGTNFNYHLFQSPDEDQHHAVGDLSPTNTLMVTTQLMDRLGPGQSMTYWAYGRLEYNTSSSDSMYYQVTPDFSLFQSGG